MRVGLARGDAWKFVWHRPASRHTIGPPREVFMAVARGAGSTLGHVEGRRI